jgi:hypothetical protein
MAHSLYVIDVPFVFLMTLENLYVVHHGNYVLKTASKFTDSCIFVTLI